MSAPEDLAATATRLAETADRFAHLLACEDNLVNLVLAARRQGYEEGLAAGRPQPRGQRSSATLHALPGGKTARKARPGRGGDAS